MRGGKAPAWTGILLLFFCGGSLLHSEILNVPGAYPTIKSAVNRASNGDTILVDDGVYLEKNIDVTREILIKAKTLFGAVIYGSKKSGDSIFIIRAAARVEGFVLKSSAIGIGQRNSPDVVWQAANLVLFDCGTGISINDAGNNVGGAVLRNIAIFGTPTSAGISTNDANSVDVAGCLLVNCGIAFAGYNHLSFRVEDSVALDCRIGFEESTSHRPIPPASSRIERSEGVRILSSASLRDSGRLEGFLSLLRNSVFRTLSPGASTKDEVAGEAIIALILGGISRVMGDFESSARSYQTAHSAAEKAGSQEFVWEALLGLARMEEARGALGEALERYKEAANHVERWLPQVPGGIHRINYLEDKMTVFEALIGLLLDKHESDPSKGYDEEAFYYAEKSKTLFEFFPSRMNGPGAGLNPSWTGKKTEAGRKIAALQIRLQNPDLRGDEKDELVSLLEMAEEDYHGALIEEERTVKRTEGDGQRSGLPSPLDFRSVRERLSGRAVLSYVLGEKESFAFLATEAGLKCARLPASATIMGMVEPYLRFLQLTDGQEFRGARGGRILFDTLLGPFAGKLNPNLRKVIVVPDGRLHYLPFEALVAAGGDGSGKVRFWGETTEITYAASATHALTEAPRRAAGGSSSGVLALGNSDGVRCDNRSRNLKQFFFPLAHVKEEVKSLARHFAGRRVTILFDREAGERQFKQADLSSYDIIHIATHGVIDDANWWRSALLLKSDKNIPEDGFLTALEISELRLGTRLVVLSACGTGTGSLFKGEGIRGLSGAFLRSGAEFVLVSLWNVNDKATAVFMGNFYRFLAGGDSPARALARTKLRMIGSGYQNPFYWAPFVLIGKADDTGGEGEEREREAGLLDDKGPRARGQ